jgi:diguanylate cyclase (GGDEF)-like protein
MDPSSGLFQEEAWRHLLSREARRATRYQDYFSVCLVTADVRSAGTTSSQEIEAAVSRKIPEFVRSTDMVGRLQPGIGVVLLHTAGRDAVGVAERIRVNLAQVDFRERPEGPPQRVTVSVGEVSFPRHGSSGEALLSRAQACLEQATQRGGNRVIYANTV